jgi:hypothetical protein
MCGHFLEDLIVFTYLLKTPLFSHLNFIGSIPLNSCVIFPPRAFLNFYAKTMHLIVRREYLTWKFMSTLLEKRSYHPTKSVRVRQRAQS